VQIPRKLIKHWKKIKKGTCVVQCTSSEVKKIVNSPPPSMGRHFPFSKLFLSQQNNKYSMLVMLEIDFNMY
jgi:hypothetical protein